MIVLKKEETKRIIGGENWTGTLFNALKGIFMVFFEIGQAVGSGVRRVTENNLCDC